MLRAIILRQARDNTWVDSHTKYFNKFSLFFSWLFFAVVWYLTALQHGDFDPDNINDEDFVPCVDAIKDFTSCFLFSVETQHTIGYGGR